MFERTELNESDVVDYDLNDENKDLLEDFAFEVYQQQSKISAERYLSGVDTQGHKYVKTFGGSMSSSAVSAAS